MASSVAARARKAKPRVSRLLPVFLPLRWEVDALGCSDPRAGDNTPMGPRVLGADPRHLFPELRKQLRKVAPHQDCDWWRSVGSPEEAKVVFDGLEVRLVENSKISPLEEIWGVLDYRGGFHLRQSRGFDCTWVVSAWAMPFTTIGDHIRFIEETSRPPAKWIALLPESGEDLMGERIKIPVRAKVIRVPD